MRDLDDDDARVGRCRRRAMPKRMRRSASGTTRPRTLMTLGTKARAPGTLVTGTGSRISRTRPASMAKISSPRPIMRTCIGVGRGLLMRVHRSSRPPALIAGSRPAPGRARRGARRRGSAPTVPSPRMVAPENIVTSACSLDSDLMTVWWLPMIWSTTRPTRRLAGRDDDHLLVRSGVARLPNDLAQPEERHEVAADVEEAAAARALVLGRSARRIPRRPTAE